MPALERDELAAVFAEGAGKGVTTVLDVVVPGRAASRSSRTFGPHRCLPAEPARRRSSPARRSPCGGRRSSAGSGRQSSSPWGARARSGWTTRHSRRVFSVPFVDGTGGGDAFDAGIMIGLCEAARQCLTLGSALGAAACGRQDDAGVYGAECDEFLRANRLTINAFNGTTLVPRLRLGALRTRLLPCAEPTAAWFLTGTR